MTVDSARLQGDVNSAVLIVGGGLAAARTCQELRNQGHAGPVTMISAESLRPYDRPPLSKNALLPDSQPIQPFNIDYDTLGVTLRLGQRVSGVDFENRYAVGTFGEIPFERLVIATGASPLRVPGSGEQLVLRTAEDAEILRRRLIPGARVVIIGASWIGAEVASTALASGCVVTVVEAGAAPLAQALGADIGSLTLPWWTGIDLRLGVTVASVEPGEVLLADGGRIPADTVLTGIGARPDVAWLQGTELELGRGVHTDQALRTSVDGVVAVGDAASWWSERYARRMSVEHWDDANKGATVAAASVIAGTQSTAIHDPVPYFWSDQFGHKVQYVGHHDGHRDYVVRRSDNEVGWSVCWYDADLKLSAVLSVDRVKGTIKARRLISGGAAVDVDRLHEPGLELQGCVA